MNACAFLYRPVPLFTLFERIPPPNVNNQTYFLLNSKSDVRRSHNFPMNFFMTHTTTEKVWSKLPPKHKKWLAYCNWMKIPENSGFILSELVVGSSEQDTGRPNDNYNHSNVWSHLNIFVWQVHLKLNWQARLNSDCFFLILVGFWDNANFISCGTCQSKIVTFAHLGDLNPQIYT